MSALNVHARMCTPPIKPSWPYPMLRGTIPDPDLPNVRLVGTIIEVFGYPSDGYPPTIIFEVDDSDPNYGGHRFDAYSYADDFRPLWGVR